MNAVKFLKVNAIKIPQDIAVVCYDSIPNYLGNEPFLTAAEQPSYNFGYLGAQLLIERIENTAPEIPRKIVLPSEIHLRESSAFKR